MSICSDVSSEIPNEPWLVSIQSDKGNFCSGSILSERIVLTTSYCANRYPLDKLVLRVGNWTMNDGGSRHRVDQTLINNAETSRTSRLELALMKVWPPFKFGSDVDKVKLPSQGDVVTRDKVANTSLVFLDNANCSKINKGFLLTWTSINRPICIGDSGDSFIRDSCTSNFGDPLVMNGTLLGVRPWPSHCNQPHCPRFYFDVALYRDWIDEKSQIFNRPDEQVEDDSTTFYFFTRLWNPLIYKLAQKSV